MKHNIYIKNGSITFKRIETEDLPLFVQNGQMKVTRVEIEDYLKRQEEKRQNDISEGIETCDEFFHRNVVKKFLNYFTVSHSQEETSELWYESYDLLIDSFKDDVEKKEFVPSCAIDTIFEDRRHKSFNHSRVGLFTMDLDLKNVPSDLLLKNTLYKNEDGSVNYKKFSETIFEIFEANEIPSLWLMFTSGSEKGIKMIFHTKNDKIESDYDTCCKLLDSILKFKLSDVVGVYDRSASCILTTPMNIHKSEKVYYNPYATYLGSYKEKKSKVFEGDINKSYTKLSSTIVNHDSKKGYESGLHMKCLKLAFKCSEIGLPRQFVEDKMVAEFGAIRYNNTGESFTTRIPNQFIKSAFSGIIPNHIQYEVVKNDLGKSILRAKLYTYDDKKLQWEINRTELLKLLKKHYFRLDDFSEYYTQKDNIITQASSLDVNKKSLFFTKFDELLERTVFLADKDLHEDDKIEISIECKTMIKGLFDMVSLKTKYTEDILKLDTKDTIYLYTVEGFIEVTKDNVTLKEYGDDDLILDAQLVKTTNNEPIYFNKYANWQNYKSLPFYKKIAGDNNPEEFEYLCSIIGHMISTHRETASNFNVMFVDGIETNDEKGGTGKSIIFNNFELLRNVLKITKNNFNDFYWSGFNRQSIIYLEDLSFNSDFNIQELRNFYDLSFESEGKGKDRRSVPAKLTPVLGITTNNTPSSLDTPDLTRLACFKPYSFFDRKENSVDKWLGKENKEAPFFVARYTTEKDWSEWLAFMIYCCQVYLNKGIIEKMRIKNQDLLKTKRNNEIAESEQSQIIIENIQDKISAWRNLGAVKFNLEVSSILDWWTKKGIKKSQVSKTFKDFTIKQFVDEGFECEFTNNLGNKKAGFKITK